MTNAEMADLVCDATGDIRISMSKDGIFLTVYGQQHKITEDQACILWDVLPQLARCRRPVGGAR